MGSFQSAPPPTQVLITSGSGYVGTSVLGALAENFGVETSVTTRDASANSASVAKLRGANDRAKIIAADDRQPASLEAALANIEVLVIIPPGSADRGEIAERWIAAARASSVKHVVLISVPDAEKELILFQKQFAKAENALKASGLNYSILRLDFFLENFYGMAAGIKASKKLYLHLGSNGAISGVSLGDIAASVSAIVSAHDRARFAKQTYTITGNSKLKGAEIAQVFTELGSQIDAEAKFDYVDVENGDDVVQAFLGMGMPDWQARGMLELFGYYKAGNSPQPNGHVKQITGEDAKSLRDVIAGGIAAFV